MTGILTLNDNNNIQNLKFNTFGQVKNYLEQNYGGVEYQGIIYISQNQWNNINENIKNNLKENFQNNIKIVKKLKNNIGILALKQNILIMEQNPQTLIDKLNKLIKNITKK